MSNVMEDVRLQAAGAQQQESATVAAADAPHGGRKQIVIIGAGFAGIAAARALKRSEADVVLIDRRNHHIFQPLLYQVATAVLSAAEIAAPIRQLAGSQKNLNVLLGEATGVDLNARTVTVITPGVGIRKSPFHFLVVATRN